jgi:hypothetical protein
VNRTRVQVPAIAGSVPCEVVNDRRFRRGNVLVFFWGSVGSKTQSVVRDTLRYNPVRTRVHLIESRRQAI